MQQKNTSSNFNWLHSFAFFVSAFRLCKNASTNLKGFNDDKSSVPSGSPPPPPSLLDSLELEPFVPQNLKESKNLGGGEKRLKLPPKSKVLSEMSLSVPYHPYTVCLVCGISHKPLQRCSRCKTATYCSRWERQYLLLLLKAKQQINKSFSSI